MHSATNTFPSTPLLGPHSVLTISRKEQLFSQLISSAIHWHNYIWNWHLMHYNSIRLKPKQDHLGIRMLYPYKTKNWDNPFFVYSLKTETNFPVSFCYRDKRSKDLWMRVKFTANLPFAKLYMDFVLKKTFFKIEKVWAIFYFFYHSAVYKDLISKKECPQILFCWQEDLPCKLTLIFYYYR